MAVTFLHQSARDPSLGPIRTLYSPSQRKVACALLAAAYGCHPAVHRSVSSERWFTEPPPDMTPLRMSAEDLEWLSNAPVEEWPGPEEFARLAEERDKC